MALEGGNDPAEDHRKDNPQQHAELAQLLFGD